MADKIAAFIGTSDDKTDGYFSGLDEIIIRKSDIDSISPDTDCVIIFQDGLGSDIKKAIEQLKKPFLPVAVATTNNDPDNLEDILDCGADDIIVLPMPKRLIKQRLTALCRISLSYSGAVDFALFDNIAASNKGMGSFIIQEDDFANIYRFVMRLLERFEKSAQLIIFNIESRFKDSFIEPEIVHTFLHVVQTCLRRGDISSLHGRQIFVILMGSDKEGGSLAAKRLIETFYAHCDDDAYDITYEMREINNK